MDEKDLDALESMGVQSLEAKLLQGILHVLRQRGLEVTAKANQTDGKPLREADKKGRGKSRR